MIAPSFVTKFCKVRERVMAPSFIAKFRKVRVDCKSLLKIQKLILKLLNLKKLLKILPLKLTKNKNLNMFTKHNNKPRCSQSHIEIVPNVRCNHPHLAGGSKLQSNFGEGASIKKGTRFLFYSQKRI